MENIIQPDSQFGPTVVKPRSVKWKMLLAFGLASLLVVGGLWVVLSTFQSNQDNRQRAATGEVLIDFDTPNLTLRPDETFSVSARLNASSKQLTALAMLIKFDPQYLTAVNVQSSNAFPVELKPAVINQSSGTIFYVLGVPALGFSYTDQHPVANLTFKTIKSGTTSITYDQEQTAATELNNTAANVIMNYGASQITISDTGTAPPSPNGSDCGWCGRECVANASTLECSRIAPPTNSTCEAVAGKCVATTCSFCGDSCSWRTADDACMLLTVPPKGQSCAIEGTSCKLVNDAITPPTDQSCQYCDDGCRWRSSFDQPCTVNTPPSGKMCSAASTTCELIEVSESVPSLTTTFKLQALAKPDITVPMQVTILYLVNGETVSDIYTTDGKSNAENKVEVTALPLTQLPEGYTGEIEVFVKPTVALRKSLGKIQIEKDQRQLSLLTDQLVPVGDFVRGIDDQGRDQTNTLGLVDLTRVINEFKKANDVFVPAEGENKELDVDYNGIVTLRDLTWAKINLDDVYLVGD